MALFFNLKKEFKEKDILELSRGLFHLLKGKIGITEALAIVSLNYEEELKLKILKVKKEIERGNSLEKSFQKISKDREFIEMIKIGEETGNLEKIFENIYDKYYFKQKLKNEIKNLSIYPITVLITAIIIVFILLKFVVPKFIVIYNDIGQELPRMTKIVIKLSDFADKYWIVIVFSIIFILFITKRWILTNKIKFEKIILKISVVGKLYREIKILNFTQNMSILLSSKISFIDALILCNRGENGFFEVEIKKNIIKLKKGNDIVKVFRNSSFFNREYISFLNIGVNTGDMDMVFKNLYEIYYNRVNEKIKLFLKILEPLSIIIIGIIIGFIVFAVMLPIFKMSEGL